jgi:hypothetical protein
MVSTLDQMGQMSIVLARTVDLDAARRFQFVDCTTKPA